jgi:hypothetical protein
MRVGLAEESPFVEIRTEANQRRFARDGTFFPAQDYSRSTLSFGTADRADPAYSSHALWHVDTSRRMVEIRLPWAVLDVTDPSTLRVFAGTDPKGTPKVKQTKGVSVAVLLVSRGGGTDRRVLASLPPAQGTALQGEPPVFSWRPWEEAQARPYHKRAYDTLSSLFARFGAGPPAREAPTPTP